MTVTPHVGSALEELLERSGRFFTPGEFSADLRTVTRRGGRDGDVFYRDRWSHDKVVRSTHGVNCTGSCSWKIYVKDGIITWETQQTDYPVGGPGPSRIRAARVSPRCVVLLVQAIRLPGCGTRTPGVCWWRCSARPRLGSATRCWPGRDIQADPDRRRRYQQARGKGGLVRVSWAEATEMGRRGPCAHDQDVRSGPGCRLHADPGDVDGHAMPQGPGSSS